MAFAWRCASRTAAAAAGVGVAALAARGPAVASSEEKNDNYWEHDARDFDLYVQKPTASDLPKLLREFQSGKEVWPWIWTQPNEDGPHHVYVGVNRAVLDEIRSTLKRKDDNVNILIVLKEPSQIQNIPPHLLDHCGVVLNANVALLNYDHRMLMLDDERVISFDRLTIV